MTTLRIEAPVNDFAAWKAAFDRDPMDRPALGVRAHRIGRPVDDPGLVLIDLDFDGRAEADACLAALEQLWLGAEAGPVLSGTPRARIVETVEELAHA
jgi:hypothetical protein